MVVFFLRIRRPPRSTRTDTLFPYTTLFRSGLAPKARVAVETISGDGVSRRVEGLTVIDYPMPRGSLAGYFPELNPLLPLDHYDPTSGTPAAKAIPVLVTAV